MRDLVISVGISFAIWWFFRDQLGGLWWILLVGLVLPVGQLVRTLVNLRRAKQELTTVHDGFVLGFGREGLQVEDAFLPWDAGYDSTASADAADTGADAAASDFGSADFGDAGFDLGF